MGKAEGGVNKGSTHTISDLLSSSADVLEMVLRHTQHQLPPQPALEFQC